MTSLVSDFIINPVLRQARRFSEISRSTSTGEGDNVPSSEARMGEPTRPPSRAINDSNVDASDARPTSSSTQATRVEPSTTEAAATGWTYPAISPSSPREQTTPAVSGLPRGQLPEDDGMGILRRRLLTIQSQEIPSSEKAKLMHEALMEGYRNSRRESRTRSLSRPSVPAGQAWEQSLSLGPLEALKFWQNSLGDGSTSEKLVLTAEDVKPTYAPVDEETPLGTLGCQHYRRNVKLQCSTCQKWYTCRFCHDHAEDHPLIRKDTKNMLCMRCACPQRASDVCVNCGETAARYFCNICKLWDDKPTKNIYHCDDCGICRRGRGIGKDVFHCKTCCACIPISFMDSHKCVERSTDSNCPICGDYMFTSPKPLCFLPCGHSIHKKCFEDHGRTSYKCPICNKSFQNMESQFRSLDVAIQSQPMPPEFRDTKAVVLCNDCCARSTSKYHWLGVKCAICRSYNTVELQILGNNAQGPPDIPLRQAGAQGSVPLGNVDAAQVEAAQRAIAARRRHSSHAHELHYHSDPRLARSLSPEHGAEMSLHPVSRTAADDSDDENDILGFWSRDSTDAATKQNDSDSDDEESEDYESDPSPDIDDDDSDDEIILIGHR